MALLRKVLIWEDTIEILRKQQQGWAGGLTRFERRQLKYCEDRLAAYYAAYPRKERL